MCVCALGEQLSIPTPPAGANAANLLLTAASASRSPGCGLVALKTLSLLTDAGYPVTKKAVDHAILACAADGLDASVVKLWKSLCRGPIRVCDGLHVLHIFFLCLVLF
jgi:hypothetical protein